MAHFGSPEAVLAAIARAARGGARAAGQDGARHLDAPASDGGLTPFTRGSLRCPTSPRDCRTWPWKAQPRRHRLRLGRRGRDAQQPRARRRDAAAVRRDAPGGPRRHHGLLGRRQVDGHERLRGRGLLLRRQPAARDDPRARGALRPRGLEGRARGRRLRRPRRRLLRGAARGARGPRGAGAAPPRALPPRRPTTPSSRASRRPAAAIRWPGRRPSSAASPWSARCSSPSRAWPTWSSTPPG